METHYIKEFTYNEAIKYLGLINYKIKNYHKSINYFNKYFELTGTKEDRILEYIDDMSKSIDKENYELFLRRKSLQYIIDYENKMNREVKIFNTKDEFDLKSSSSSETRIIKFCILRENVEIIMTVSEWNKAAEVENNYFIYLINIVNDNLIKFYIIQNPSNKNLFKFDPYNKLYKLGNLNSLEQYEIE